MGLKFHLRKMKIWIAFRVFLLGNLFKERFECPICGYNGPFVDVNRPTYVRKHAKCPKCGAFERHRIQYLAMSNLLNNVDTSSLKMLHFAPESFFREFFSKLFGQYETADFSMKNVDHNVDLLNLPFEDQSYDFVFASHVLEHIPNDEKAISEIRRILKPNGVAILPVPLGGEKTIEYPEPNPNQHYHVRAPGFDYFDRFSRHFSKIEKYTSDSFPRKHQVFICFDWTQMPFEKRIDVVPVCYV